MGVVTIIDITKKKKIVNLGRLIKKSNSITLLNVNCIEKQTVI